MSDQENVLEEHFWFTATTVGVNGFLMASNIEPRLSMFVRALSTLISGYAVFLIVHRSAARTGKVKLPQDLAALPESEKTFVHKARETWHHLRIFPSHLFFIVCEFSGAFFYLVLVVASCIGVWLALVGQPPK